MSEELEKLQNLGAQKIYETTHIPIKYVQSMLHDSFEGFSKVQFIGFISILEREYQEDLSELKASGLAYFDEQKEDKADEGLFVVPKRTKRNNTLYLMIILVIFLIVLALKFTVFTDIANETSVVDNTRIESAKENIQPSLVESDENNLTQDNNLTLLGDVNATLIEEEEVVVEPEAIEETFKIVSNSKVWFGYIDVKTNKHYDRTFKGEKDLDPSKTWLLLFGHGYINMFVNGEIQKFSSRDKVRFLYKDNKLSSITVKEFKKLNKGRKW